MEGRLETQNFGGSGGFGGFGGGFGGIGLFGLLGLRGIGDMGERRGGEGGDCASSIFAATTLSKLGTIEGAIPLAALSAQNAILEQTIAITNQLNQGNLAQLAASSAVKDAIQNAAVINLGATNAQGESTRALITQLNTDNLNRLLTVADLDRRDERSFARSKEVEVNVTQTVNQAQAQAQLQAQQQQMGNVLNSILCGVNHGVQLAHATNQNIIAGNTGAVTTGAQAANPTNVNT